jgi:hypothetical protein
MYAAFAIPVMLSQKDIPGINATEPLHREQASSSLLLQPKIQRHWRLGARLEKHNLASQRSSKAEISQDRKMVPLSCKSADKHLLAISGEDAVLVKPMLR